MLCESQIKQRLWNTVALLPGTCSIHVRELLLHTDGFIPILRGFLRSPPSGAPVASQLVSLPSASQFSTAPFSFPGDAFRFHLSRFGSSIMGPLAVDDPRADGSMDQLPSKIQDRFMKIFPKWAFLPLELLDLDLRLRSLQIFSLLSEERQDERQL